MALLSQTIDEPSLARPSTGTHPLGDFDLSLGNGFGVVLTSAAVLSVRQTTINCFDEKHKKTGAQARLPLGLGF